MFVRFPLGSLLLIYTDVYFQIDSYNFQSEPGTPPSFQLLGVAVVLNYTNKSGHEWTHFNGLLVIFALLLLLVLCVCVCFCTLFIKDVALYEVYVEQSDCTL